MSKKKIIVTGGCGFIGSHLCEALLALGHEVTVLDNFTDYYPRRFKESNIGELKKKKNFSLVEEDLMDIDLNHHIRGTDVVFHLAAQPGVRTSWGSFFEVYLKNNVLATQRLLETLKKEGVSRLVYASSSSVYGNAEQLVTDENSPTKPVSPYGVTKLAGENLCNLYHKNWRIPVVSLRFFTVYGPRQRPDMGFHRFIKSAIEGSEIVVYGDGYQSRDFTYVADAVQACIAAMDEEITAGSIFNVGGGTQATVRETIEMIAKLTDPDLKIRFSKFEAGDVMHTSADCSKAREFLKFDPKMNLYEGLRKEVEWLKTIYR